MPKYDIKRLKALLEESRKEFREHIKEISDIFEAQLGIIEQLVKEASESD